MAATKQKETQLSESLIPTNNNIQKLFYSVVSAYSDVIFTIPSLKESKGFSFRKLQILTQSLTTLKMSTLTPQSSLPCG